MSYLHDEMDDDPADRPAHHSQGRELTLGTGTILGIFFGLALICALFFGFGYNMGSRSHQAPIVVDTAPPSSPADFNHFKPSPGTPASQLASSSTSPKPAEVPALSANATTPAQPAPIIRTTASTPATSAKPAVAPRPTPANETGLTFTVQVAAVSHQEDADSLIAALKRKNYSVNARTEPQDHLIHIQIGPFASKKDADAMRLRLLADGYNAIVK